MKKFLTTAEHEKIIAGMNEQPIPVDELYKLLGYKTKKTFLNNAKKYPHRTDPVSGRKIYFMSEINKFLGKAA